MKGLPKNIIVTISEALKREKQIKEWKRGWK
jgi:predicted GIY-YIG superfamily endonuclease